MATLPAKLMTKTFSSPSHQSVSCLWSSILLYPPLQLVNVFSAQQGLFPVPGGQEWTHTTLRISSFSSWIKDIATLVRSSVPYCTSMLTKSTLNGMLINNVYCHNYCSLPFEACYFSMSLVMTGYVICFEIFTLCWGHLSWYILFIYLI